MEIKNSNCIYQIQYYNSDISDDIISQFIVIESGTTYTLPDMPDGTIVWCCNNSGGTVAVNSFNILDQKHQEFFRVGGVWKPFA